jgi:glycosyltransferase involved in cell wall biosynthesis
MKILWVVGFVIPQASELIDGKKMPFGGWVSQMIDLLSKNEEFEIGVAMKSDVNKLLIKNHNGVKYYYLPKNKNNNYDIEELDCLKVIKDFKPNLLHCEGTELKHTNTFLKLWKGKNVVSLQGIINGYEPYEYGDLSPYKFMCSLNLKKMLFGLLMVLNKYLLFYPRLKIERDTIARAQNLLGRTIWDRSNSYFYNSKANYFTCKRVLRPEFYNKEWEISKCEPYSLFIGNSAQLRKGAHFVIEAIDLLKTEYPQIKLYIAGDAFDNSVKSFKSYFGYRGFLFNKIKVMNLEKHVEFLGVLQESEMQQALISSNIYIMSSVIENSPNTLGEAMIMGVPCVASYNGGVSEMAADEIEALLYRSNDSKMLAFQIKRIFDSTELAIRLGQSARKKALITHDKQQNLNDLINCYKSILNV